MDLLRRFPFLWLLVTFVAGSLCFSLLTDRSSAGEDAALPDRKGIFRVWVTEAPTRQADRLRMPVELLAVTDSLGTRDIGISAMLVWLPDTSLVVALDSLPDYEQNDAPGYVPQEGDIFLARGRFSTEGHRTGGYVLQQGSMRLGQERPRGIMASFRRLRRRLEEHLLFLPDRERSLVESLLLGDRRELSWESRMAFSRAGAMHVLAVSGLHVMLLAGLIEWLLGWLLPGPVCYEDRGKRWVQALVPVGVLSAYAVFTGLAPSVMRAVLMYAMLKVGKLLRPVRVPLNEIAASACFILASRPGVLYEPGFLLSYSAVLGIVLWYPMLEPLARRSPCRRCVDLLLVSLCAQVATLPWTICFFGQVSVYFLLTNIVVLPLVEFILFPAFFCWLVTGWIPGVRRLSEWLLEKTASGLHAYVDWVQSLPMSSVTVSDVGQATWLAGVLVGICFIVGLVYDVRRSYLA